MALALDSVTTVTQMSLVSASVARHPVLAATAHPISARSAMALLVVASSTRVCAWLSAQLALCSYQPIKASLHVLSATILTCALFAAPKILQLASIVSHLMYCMKVYVLLAAQAHTRRTLTALLAFQSPSTIWRWSTSHS